MKVFLDSLPDIVFLLKKPQGTQVLYQKIFFDTEKKRTIIFSPLYCYIFENLICEDYDRRIYAVTYDTFKLGLREGSLEIHDNEIRINKMVISTDSTKLGQNSEEILLTTIQSIEDIMTKRSWVTFPKEITEEIKEIQRFGDYKSERSYVYLHNNLLLTLHNGEFIATASCPSNLTLALSLEASNILFGFTHGNFEISFNGDSKELKDDILFRGDGFFGSTKNFTSRSYRFEDLPTKERIEGVLTLASSHIEVTKEINYKIKDLLRLLSPHIKNERLVVQFASYGLRIVDSKSNKVLGYLQECPWYLEHLVEFSFQTFLKLFSLCNGNWSLKFSPLKGGQALSSWSFENKDILISTNIKEIRENE